LEVERDAVDVILEQWARERPDLDASPIGVVGRVSRLSRHLERRLEPVFAEHGLDGGLFDVLVTMRRSGPPYRLSPTQLYSTTMLSSGAMTSRLDRLERAGLVSRSPDPDDRRGLLVELTPEGRRVVDRAMAAHVGNEAGLVGALTAAEREQLARLLRKLLLSFESESERPGGAGT
jgi:DNA-binding MarR family transcriptional regulator